VTVARREEAQRGRNCRREESCGVGGDVDSNGGDIGELATTPSRRGHAAASRGVDSDDEAALDIDDEDSNIVLEREAGENRRGK